MLRRLAAVPLLLLGTLLPPSVARAQGAPAAVPGGSLLAWLGQEAGDRLTYATMDGRRICVVVGEPIAIGERRYAPLYGLPWPTLATDSQIYLPLDGTLGVGVIRTPTLRKSGAFDWLIAPAPRRFLANADIARPGAIPADGWYAVGGEPDDPDAFLHAWCVFCADAGTYTWLERGKGITRIEAMTIAGPERVTLVGEGCPAEGTEVQLYVEPAPERAP
jgi:hypothetical protein